MPATAAPPRCCRCRLRPGVYGEPGAAVCADCLPDILAMSTISASSSRGGDSNAGTAANTFESRTADPARSGKEKTPVDGQNSGTAASTFEQRASQGGIAH